LGRFGGVVTFSCGVCSFLSVGPPRACSEGGLDGGQVGDFSCSGWLLGFDLLCLLGQLSLLYLGEVLIDDDVEVSYDGR